MTSRALLFYAGFTLACGALAWMLVSNLVEPKASFDRLAQAFGWIGCIMMLFAAYKRNAANSGPTR